MRGDRADADTASGGGPEHLYAVGIQAIADGDPATSDLRRVQERPESGERNELPGADRLSEQAHRGGDAAECQRQDRQPGRLEHV